MATFSDPEDPNYFIWRRYMRHLEVSNHSSRTMVSYTESAQLLAELAKDADLLELEREDIQARILSMRGMYPPRTVQLRFRSVRAFYNWAVPDWIDKSPMAGMPVPKAPVTVVPVPDTSDLQFMQGLEGNVLQSLTCRSTPRPWCTCRTGGRALARVEANGMLAEKAKVRAAVKSQHLDVPSSKGNGGSKAASANKKTVPQSPKGLRRTK